MFYEQLLCKQIPKVKKDPGDLTVFFVLLGSESVKAPNKQVGEIEFRPCSLWGYLVINIAYAIDCDSYNLAGFCFVLILTTLEE